MADYLYNAIKLPALPEIEGFPYLAIHYHKCLAHPDGHYCLIATAEPMVYKLVDQYNADGELQGQVWFNMEAQLPWKWYSLDGDDWTLDGWGGEGGWFVTGNITSLNPDGISSEYPPLWANHDILNEDGSVYLAASDPILIDFSSFYFLSGLLFAQKVILPLTFLQYPLNSLQDINNIILKSLDDYFLIPNEKEE